MTALPRVDHPVERPSVLRNQPLRRDHLELSPTLVSPLVEGRIYDGAIDALESQLVADGTLAARSGAIARLNPRPRKRLIVEDAELLKATDRAVNQVCSITGSRQPPTDLRNGSCPHFDEPRRRLEHHLWIINSSPPLAPLCD